MLLKFQHGAFCQPVLRSDWLKSQFSFAHWQVKEFCTATWTQDFPFTGAGSSGGNLLHVLIYSKQPESSAFTPRQRWKINLISEGIVLYFTPLLNLVFSDLFLLGFFLYLPFDSAERDKKRGDRDKGLTFEQSNLRTLRLCGRPTCALTIKLLGTSVKKNSLNTATDLKAWNTSFTWQPK